MEKFESPKQERSLWKNVQEIGKVAALSTLVALLGAENALAKDKNVSPENTKIKIEQLKSKIADEEKIVEKIADKKGRSLTINDIEAKELKTKSGDKFTILHFSDGKIAVLLQTSDRKLTYLDRGNKGFINRVIVDDEQKSGVEEDARRAFDEMDAFSDMNSIAEKANIESDFKPKDKAVHEISEKNGEYSIHTVNFKTGEKSVFKGNEAAHLVSEVEDGFLSALEVAEK